MGNDESAKAGLILFRFSAMIKININGSDVTGDGSGDNHDGASDHTAGRLGKEQRVFIHACSFSSF
jgi:hypothetical protein